MRRNGFVNGPARGAAPLAGGRGGALPARFAPCSAFVFAFFAADEAFVFACFATGEVFVCAGFAPCGAFGLALGAQRVPFFGASGPFGDA